VRSRLQDELHLGGYELFGSMCDSATRVHIPNDGPCLRGFRAAIDGNGACTHAAMGQSETWAIAAPCQPLPIRAVNLLSRSSLGDAAGWMSFGRPIAPASVVMSFVWKLTCAAGDPSGQYFVPDAALSTFVREPASSAWQDRVPELTGARVTLRELSAGDAPSLFAAVASPEVTRFISQPPSTVEGFEQFIGWTQRQRALGRGVSFAIVPRGSDVAIGLFQVRAVQSGFGTAEWGFLMASEFWGSGMFVDSARLVMDFTFGVLGSHRLEARAAIRNARGHGALRKIGAVREGTLRKSFLRRGEVCDQALWTILVDDWCAAQAPRESAVIH
jgi:RimJ/RimL family protein N-acetyltransferase